MRFFFTLFTLQSEILSKSFKRVRILHAYSLARFFIVFFYIEIIILKYFCSVSNTKVSEVRTVMLKILIINLKFTTQVLLSKIILRKFR